MPISINQVILQKNYFMFLDINFNSFQGYVN